MGRAVSLAGIVAGIVVDIAVLASPLPVAVRAGLAPFLGGLLAGLAARTGWRALLGSLAVAVAVLIVSALYNYFQAPVEALNAINRPGFYSFIPVIVHSVSAASAGLGAYMVRTGLRGF